MLKYDFFVQDSQPHIEWCLQTNSKALWNFIPFEINLAHEMFYRNIVFAALVWQLVPLPGVDPWSELFNLFLFCFSFILKMNFRVIVQSQIWFFNFFPDFLLFGGEFWRNLLQTLIYVREKIWFLFCMYWYKDHMGFFNFLKTLLKYLIEIHVL